MKINKLLSIFFSVALLSACSDNLEPLPVPQDVTEFGYEHDGMVTFVFSPDLSRTGVDTKALDEKPEIESMHVAVFDSTGFKLSQYILADPFTSATANDTDYKYTVELKVSDKPRILHFIANGPDELRFGSEIEVVGELYTTGSKSAYWQRIVLPNITAKPETGEEDYDAKLAAYNNVVDALDGVKLIRNFSKVTLVEECDNFELDGFWFVNYPSCGSVAPYNRNTGKFVDNYLDHSTVKSLQGPSDSTYTFNIGEPDEYSIKGANYQGFMNASTTFIDHEPFDVTNMHALSSGKCIGYVYEREKALISPIYLIVKGKYSGGSATYYKIALQDAAGDFYAMLRNFDYLVKIQNVASAGYASAEAAYAGAPSGDISVNVDYLELPNISDGDARMTVSETTLMIIGTPGKDTTATFWYMYEPDIAGHEFTGIHNTRVIEDPASPKTDEPYVTIDYEGSSASTGNVISSLTVATSDDGGHRLVTIRTTSVGELPKTQSITVTGKKWDGTRYLTITRKINLVLRKPLALELTASPNTDAAGNGYVEAGSGKDVVINLGIEGGLPSSLFPLEFKIDPVNHSLTPDNDYSAVQDLPVRTGLDAGGRPTYWFEKTLSWTEYDGADMTDGVKTFPIYFSTIVANSATKVIASQSYFISDTTEVKNFSPETFSSLAFSGTTHEVETAETFSFKMSAVPSDGVVTVAMKGLEPAASSGLTYVGQDSDGYWIYKLSGVTSTTASFDVVPFEYGTAKIILSARLFADAAKTMYVGTKPAVNTVIFNDTFGTSNVAIASYSGGGIDGTYNKTGITYSLSGGNTSISTTTTSMSYMTTGHIHYNSSTSNDSATITISGINPYGAKKVTLSFNAYISNTSRVSGTSSVNGSTAKAISSGTPSGSNSYDVDLADDADTIEIKFVITHASNSNSGTLGIDNVKLTVKE